MGTPRYLSVVLILIIFSTQTLAATSSDEYLAISDVGCFLDHYSIGVWLMKCKIHVTPQHVRTLWYKFVST